MEQDQADTRFGGALGQKRKWGEEKQGANASNKRRKVGSGDKAAAQASPDNDDDSEASDDEPEAEPEGFQGPAKIVSSSESITLNARLAFVDFAGLHDQRSLQMLIPLIGPKKLILTAGSTQETLALSSDCNELLGIKIAGADEESSAEIFTPSNGVTIDASVDTNAWIVKLSKNLTKTLRWQQVKNIGVFTVQGQLTTEKPEPVNIEDDPKSKKQKIDTEIARETTPQLAVTMPVLDTLPATLAASTRSVTQPIHVGDMRLADLRRLLTSKGHAAEFRGEGTILVDGIILVRKLVSGKIIVEGAPVNTVPSMPNRILDSFNHVKQQIYEGLAVVAAG